MENSFSHHKGKDVDVSQGPPKKRKGDVMQIPGLINTPPVMGENTPSSSRQDTHVRYPMHDLNLDCISKNPNLTIIFFHGIAYGIDDDWKQTWTTRPVDGNEECICWPQMWIPKDLNDNVKILSLSYDSNVVGSVHNHVTEIGQNLIQSLVTDSSVPHSGGTKDFSKYFKWQCQQIAKDKTPSSLLKHMESFNREMKQLSIDFQKSIRKDINIYAFTEGLPIDNKWGILVPKASAIELSNDNNYTVEDANHLTICKPPSKDHLSYSKLLDCLKFFMKEKKNELCHLCHVMRWRWMIKQMP